jgi:hypothetical protein
MCEKQILETFPLFFRVKIDRCGVDRNAVMQTVGLAQTIAPGNPRDGLALAHIMGPQPKPVILLDEWETVSICVNCQTTATIDDVVLKMMTKNA